MPVTYINRKGYTYYLCQGVTKKGRPRYFFSREPKGTVLEEIPEGYEIRESVNGVVSLAKSKPLELLDDEIAAVQQALDSHPEARKYRKDVKPRHITIYESLGPDMGELLPDVKEVVGSEEEARQLLEKHRDTGQFTPVLRFTLMDRDNRLFEAERMCYRGGVEDWIGIALGKPIHELCAQLIPKLGTEEFFELI